MPPTPEADGRPASPLDGGSPPGSPPAAPALAATHLLAPPAPAAGALALHLAAAAASTPGSPRPPITAWAREETPGAATDAASAEEDPLVLRMKLNHDLLMAARRGDLASVQQVVRDGADVNFTTAFHDSPLGLAGMFGTASAGSEPCVDFLLRAGASTQHFDVKNRTPLCTALLNGCSLSMAQLLVQHGASLLPPVRSLTNVLEGVNPRALRQLMHPSIICASRAPIDTAFQLADELRRLASRQEERYAEYMELAEQSSQLAVDLLSQCADLWDVRRLLSTRNRILSHALAHEQKNFVAHPLTQEYLKELWLGSYKGTFGWAWLRLCLYYFASPVLLVAYFVAFLLRERTSLRYSKLGDLMHLCSTPFFKFLGSSLSFVAFLALLVMAANETSQAEPTRLELVLLFWVVSLILAELREAYQTPRHVYLTSLWNLLDALIFTIFTVLIVLRLVVYFDPQQQTLLHTANLIFAANSALCFIRLLNILQALRLLGPLQLSLAWILRDAGVFLAILVIFLLSFTVAMAKSFTSLGAGAEVAAEFSSVASTAHTLFWSLFGFRDLEALDAAGANASSTLVVAQLFFATYMVLVFILLLNLLIALMSATFARIHANSDVEWKFQRARLIRDFCGYPSTPPPLNLLAEPVLLVLALFGITVDPTGEAGPRTSTDEKEETEQLRVLTQRLVAHYLAEGAPSTDDDGSSCCSTPSSASDDSAGEYDGSGAGAGAGGSSRASGSRASGSAARRNGRRRPRKHHRPANLPMGAHFKGPQKEILLHPLATGEALPDASVAREFLTKTGNRPPQILVECDADAKSWTSAEHSGAGRTASQGSPHSSRRSSRLPSATSDVDSDAGDGAAGSAAEGGGGPAEPASPSLRLPPASRWQRAGAAALESVSRSGRARTRARARAAENHGHTREGPSARKIEAEVTRMAAEITEVRALLAQLLAQQDQSRELRTPERSEG